MVSIKMFGVRDEERPMAENWAKEHNVKIDMTSDILTSDTIDEVKGFDGLTLMQVAEVTDDLYPKLKEFGIKQIAQRSAGYDMYDLDAAKENGIIITNVPSYSPESIAEYTVTTALNLVRKFPLIEKRVKEHNFSWEPEIRGRVIGDMTVAVIGTGRIGYHVAKIFHGFGAKVVGYDLYPSDKLDGILEYRDSVEDAIRDADIISLHIPAFKENHHMFNYEMFKKFKSDAVLVNMARGALIDTEDLLKALDDGLLAGAGLDVYEHEGPLVPIDLTGKDIEDETFKKVLESDKIIYSPHVAYYTDEAVRNLVEGGLNATLEVLETGDASTRVN